MGFDPAFSAYSPGTVLLASMIRDSCHREDHTFDLGSDYLDVKQPWTTSVDHSYRCTHYRLGAPKAHLLRCKHWLQAKISRARGSA